MKKFVFIYLMLYCLPGYTTVFNVISFDMTKTADTAFGKVGSEWYYEMQPMGGCIPCVVSFQNLRITGDTTIQSKNCRVLKRLNAPNICDNMGATYEFIYLNNDTLFWYNKTIKNFTILYDFSADVGDSWEIFVNSCSFMVHVYEVDSVLIYDKYHKKIHIRDDNGYFTGSIIENIGHTKSFFPRNIYWECEGLGCDSDFIDGLRCSLQSDTLIYKWKPEPCDTTYLITKVKKNAYANGFMLYPNPAFDYLEISLPIDLFNSSDPFYYHLLNAQGQLVKKARVTIDYKINVGDLARGIYFFQLYDETSNVLIYNLKIMKK